MIKKLLHAQDLSQKEIYQLFAGFSENTIEKQAAILALLQAKPLAISEILGALVFFSQYRKRIQHDYDLVDIVGTGGDTLGTFNISTAASMVVASCGVFVAKHGGGSATSLAGSQNVIEALNIKMPKTSEDVLEDLKDRSYSYLSAPLFNSELSKYRQIRKSMGMPTIFNVLGPLLHPMQPKRMVIGVYSRDLMHSVAEILKSMKVRHAMVVHSKEGMDEISISHSTEVIEIKNQITKSYQISPTDFGFSYAKLTDVLGGNAYENANIITELFAGNLQGPKLDILILNAAAGLYVSGKATSLEQGIVLARLAIEEGRALRLLNTLRMN